LYLKNFSRAAKITWNTFFTIKALHYVTFYV
jgi:hypothetical protein